MTIYLLICSDEAGSMTVAAYLREELALAARDKLGMRSHTVESIDVMDA